MTFLGALRQYLVELSSLMGGAATFLVTHVPGSYTKLVIEYGIKFGFGCMGALVYGAIGWGIKYYLDKKFKKKDEG